MVGVVGYPEALGCSRPSAQSPGSFRASPWANSVYCPSALRLSTGRPRAALFWTAFQLRRTRMAQVAVTKVNDVEKKTLPVFGEIAKRLQGVQRRAFDLFE